MPWETIHAHDVTLEHSSVTVLQYIQPGVQGTDDCCVMDSLFQTTLISSPHVMLLCSNLGGGDDQVEAETQEHHNETSPAGGGRINIVSMIYFAT